MNFIQARHFLPTGGRRINVIVVHTMEAPESQGRARWCAQFFAGAGSPIASAHYAVDNREIVQMVRDKDVAYHAPGKNSDGIGIEHAGTAHQSVPQWEDSYSEAMLKKSAKLAASLAKKHKIPAVWLSPGDLRAGRRGITSHNNVSQAFHLSTHWDPGPRFESGAYVREVRRLIKNGDLDFEEYHGPPPTVRRGDKGFPVKKAQRLLRVAGYRSIAIDNIFGVQTARIARQFQKRSHLTVDGVVGPKTWKALMKAAGRKDSAKQHSVVFPLQFAEPLEEHPTEAEPALT